jgi:hypothetical protein
MPICLYAINIEVCQSPAMPMAVTMPQHGNGDHQDADRCNICRINVVTVTTSTLRTVTLPPVLLPDGFPLLASSRPGDPLAWIT